MSIFACINSADISAVFTDTDKDITMVILKCGEKLIFPNYVVQEELEEMGIKELGTMIAEEWFPSGRSTLFIGNPNAIRNYSEYCTKKPAEPEPASEEVPTKLYQF